MKALVLKGKNEPLFFGDFPDPQPEEGEVVVEIKAAALNHRDVFITQGLYPGITFPVILGSDGSGLYQGREVIFNPGMNWGNHPGYPSRNYQIIGLPKNGTFSERMAIPAGQLIGKPPHLNWEEAAALPLAGLTAYRALFTRAMVRKGDKVLITGAGGGVALIALQFALAAGASVFMTSGSDEKIERAMALGAGGGVNYRSENWSEALEKKAGRFDVVLDSAGGEGFSHLIRLCNYGARVVIYGGTHGVAKLSPQLMFWRQITILGTSMGNDREFADMVEFVRKYRIVPVLDSVYPLSEGAKGFERMDRGLQFGKIVFRIQ